VAVVVRSSRAQTFWLWELLESFMPQEEATKAGSSLAESAKSKLLAEHVRLLWPSVEAVRTSAKGWASGGYVKSSRRVPQCKSKAWGMVCTVLVRRPATAAGFTAHLRTLTAACASHVACVAGVAIYARLCELMELKLLSPRGG